jgi:hypothetical protein
MRHPVVYKMQADLDIAIAALREIATGNDYNVTGAMLAVMLREKALAALIQLGVDP